MEENAVRIQQSILNPIEKKFLNWLSEKLPSGVSSDSMTILGFIGSLIISLGYLMTTHGPGWLWVASLGFIIHWIGDSMDGTLARYRGQQRPIYGFYLDHNMDCITELFIFGGMGLSAYMHLWVGLSIFCVYLALEVYVMICAHLKNEFKLTYGIFGPTEFRLLVVILNSIVYFCEPCQRICFKVRFLFFRDNLYFLDIVGLAVLAILIIIYVSSLISDGKYFSKIDPLLE